jgi:excisionase family DNA binding protein
MAQDPRSYTTLDVARRLGVSLQTVQRWVDAGRLQAWKTLGGHRRIEASSAERLFAEQEQRIGLAPSDTTGRATPAPRSPVAVVVDDDPGVRDILATLVQRALPDVQVESAADGFQGLVAIGKTAPEVVVTDIHMPHMNGFEMLRSLLESDGPRPRILVAVSALSAEELAKLGQLPEGVLLFRKPLDADSFVAALQRVR